jgi:hypothetical protein
MEIQQDNSSDSNNLVTGHSGRTSLYSCAGSCHIGTCGSCTN